MKSSLFVASSSESIRIAEAVQQNLQHMVDVTLWNQSVLELSRPILHNLLRSVRRHDYAVFVFAPDDVILLRNEVQLATRDNVMFELGMFVSALGPERCFIAAPRNVGDFRIPTDLAGVIPAWYDPASHEGNIKAAVGSACAEIADCIRQSGRLSGEWLVYTSGSNHEEPNGLMFITCAGEKASARLSLTKNTEGAPISRRFRYEGRYVAGQFAMTYEQGEADDQIVGSIVLRANSSRSEMQGQSVFWHHDQGKMVAVEFKLRRLPVNSCK